MSATDLTSPAHVPEPPSTPHSYSLKASPLYAQSAADLIAFLADGSNLPELHPLIVGVRCIHKPELTTDGTHMTAVYEVTDEMTVLGCFKTKVIYPAQVWYATGHAGGCMIWWKTTTKGVTVLHQQFVMMQGADQNGNVMYQLQQHTWIEAPWYLKGYVTNTARRAHAATMRRLEQRFQPGALRVSRPQETT